MATKPKKASQKTRSYKHEKTKKRAKKEQQSSTETRKAKKKRRRRPLRRVFPIVVRLIFIAALCVGALILGAMVGYGILGEGEPKDILQKETWQHIIDIVTKE